MYILENCICCSLPHPKDTIDEVVFISNDLNEIVNVMKSSEIYKRIGTTNNLAPYFMIVRITNHVNTERFEKEHTELEVDLADGEFGDEGKTYLRLYRLMDALTVIDANKAPVLLLDYKGSLMGSIGEQRYAVLREYDTTRAEQDYLPNPGRMT